MRQERACLFISSSRPNLHKNKPSVYLSNGLLFICDGVSCGVGSKRVYKMGGLFLSVIHHPRVNYVVCVLSRAFITVIPLRERAQSSAAQLRPGRLRALHAAHTAPRVSHKTRLTRTISLFHPIKADEI